MTLGFRRPIGSAADVKELEYISAIHQTDLQEVRSDGSIDENDIQLFILSRYGIDVSTEEIRSKVMCGFLGGGERGGDRLGLDLMEVVAILMIPTFRKAAYDGGELPEGVVKPREGLLDFVLQMMLHDCTGTSEPKRLSKGLIRRLLRSYGETDLAANDELVRDMVLAANTPNRNLDGQAFAQALTQDVQLYNISNEKRTSTIYDDVCLTKNHTQPQEWDEAVEGISTEIASSQRMLGADLHARRYTFSAIDTTAGSYRSKSIIVLLWSSFTLAYFVYHYQELSGTVGVDCVEYPYEYGVSWGQQAEAMECSIFSSILRWSAIFFFVIAYGVTFIGFASIGNYVECTRWYVPLIGAISALFAVLLPYMNIQDASKDRYLATSALILGVVVAILHIFHMLSLLLPTAWIRARPRWERILLTHPVSGETNVKRAAAFKMNQMTRNALDIAENKQKDGVLVTHFGQALQTFSQEKKHKPAGGFVWTWKKAFNNELFRQEGIWLSARLLSSNVAQFIVSVFVLVAGFRVTGRVSAAYDKEEAKAAAGEYIALLFDLKTESGLASNLVANISSHFTAFLVSTGQNGTTVDGECNGTIEHSDLSSLAESACGLVGELYQCDGISGVDYFCALSESTGNFTGQTQADSLLNLGLLNASGLDVDSMLAASRSALQIAAEASVESLYPAEKYMVEIPFVIGSVLAFLTAVSLAITYIPSTTATTLKLRCGIIPTLTDPKFYLYRGAADQVTVLLGSLFWGCLIASVLVGALVGGVAFIFLWQASIALVQRFLSFVVGITAVIIFKLVMVQCCRCACYTAFYRRRPVQANLSSLALECANYALSVGFVLIRMVKLLITAALYVGRIDSFFLAPEVGELNIGKLHFRLDNYPHIFLKDILSHEAHRHPYIELLGCMYLLKLRYGNHFGNRGGSTWRLLFVYALMPWMHKYRIATRSSTNIRNQHDSDADEDEDEESISMAPPSTTKTLEFVNLHRDYDFSTEFSKEFAVDLTEEESPGDQVKIAAPQASCLAVAVPPLSRRQLLLGGQEGEDSENVPRSIAAANDETTQLRASVKNLQEQVQQLQDRLNRQDQQEEVVERCLIDDGASTLVAKN